MLDIIEVVLKPNESVLLRTRIALSNQTPSSHAGFHDMPEPVEWNLCGQPIDKLRPLRARADGAHFALEDVEELREFVEVGSAQKAPDPRRPGVIPPRPNGGSVFRVPNHRANLVCAKDSPALAHSFLNIKDRAARIEIDRRRDERQDHGKTEEAEKGQNDVDEPLAGAPECARAASLHRYLNVPVLPNVLDRHATGHPFIHLRHGKNFDALLDTG